MPSASQLRDRGVQRSRLDVQQSTMVAAPEIGLEQRRRLSFEHPVDEDLETTGVEAFARSTRALSQLSHRVESTPAEGSTALGVARRRLRRRRAAVDTGARAERPGAGEHARGQLSRGVGCLVGVEVVPVDAGIDHRGDPEARRRLQGVPQPGAPVLGRRRRQSMETSAAALSRRVPLGSPLGRSRSITPLRGSGVERSMPAIASALELTQAECPSAPSRNTGPIRDDGVEHRPVRVRRRKQREVPTGADQPTLRVGSRPRGALAHLGQDRVDGPGLDQRARQCAHAARDRMDVRVVKPRQHHLPVEVDDLRVRSDRRRDLGVAPHRRDATIVDRDRSRAGADRVHGVDGASAQHQIGLRR